jgi:hypothetical protein
MPPQPAPSPRDVAEAKLEEEGPALAADWSQPETEAWILSWVDRIAQGYDEELLRLNNLD